MGIISDVIGGVASIGSAIGSIGSGNRAKKEAAKQRDWEEKMWQMNNEYNTPANQKQRLKDAGLNPSLMYETQPQNVSEQVSTPNYNTGVNEARQTTLQNFQNMAQSLQNASNAMVQNDAIRAETALKKQQFDFNAAMNPELVSGKKSSNLGINLDNAYKQIQNKYAAQTNELRNDGQKLLNDKLGKELSFMDQNQKLFVREKLASIKQMYGNIKLMSSQERLNAVNAMRTSILAEIDGYERDMRKNNGTSYGDNIIFRETKNTIMEMISYLKSPKQRKTSMMPSLIDALMELLN